MKKTILIDILAILFASCSPGHWVFKSGPYHDYKAMQEAKKAKLANQSTSKR